MAAGEAAFAVQASALASISPSATPTESKVVGIVFSLVKRSPALAGLS
jgi:hypothetical protein